MNISSTCANPLLLEWMKELYDGARDRNTKGVTTYKRAHDAMKACPLIFSHPSEAQQLSGIGPKICDYLTDKLKEHCEANGLPTPKKPKGKVRKRLSAEDLVEAEEPIPAKKPRKAKPYVPSLRTGPYALILALSSLSEDSLQSLSKAQVIELAQPHCESSFTTPSEAGKFYTAWNSMTTLVNKDLVHERGRPQRRYALTEEGWEVAGRIRAVQSDEGAGRATSSKDPTPANAKGAVSGPSKTKSESDDLFLDLEDDSEGDYAVIAQPKPSSPAPKPSAHVGSGQIAGQRIGKAPEDKSGTFSKTRERKEPKAKPPNSSVVEILSSNEGSTAPNIPWSSSTFKQTCRSMATKPQSDGSSHGKGSPPCRINANKPTARQPPESASENPPGLPSFHPLTLQPGTYRVELVLDNREVRTKEDRDYIADCLLKNGVRPLVRPLDLGDFLWVAKVNDPGLLSRYGEEGDEIALDWIVERKRLDDLVGSITDGRFQEQKFRLRKSGVRNVIYLIEEFSLSAEKSQKFHEAINSAIASTQVVNGYFVKRTTKLDETIRYLARTTRMLKRLYEQKPLYLIPTSVLSPTTYLPLLTHLRTHPEHEGRNYNITYSSFASLSSKSDTLNLRDVFLKMLMCTRGISGDKALAIQKVWKTPRAFIEGFEACATQKERETLVETKLGGNVGRTKVKGVLGAKVAGVWGEQ